MTCQVGYCTNVHAGAGLAETRSNLQRFALEVKRRVSPDRPMGVGLWLSASAAGALVGDAALDDFAAWLRDVGLVPFTMNGFPYGDFHQPVVKHRVYEPRWWNRKRLDYTKRLIDIHTRILPPGEPGSISTLPLAWHEPAPTAGQLEAAARQLCEVADYLAAAETRSGHRICLCLEPEPGAVLQRSGQLVDFFEQYLFARGDEDRRRRYLAVCHDVCHAAVMFESQRDALANYQRAGLRVGKVQISSAIRLDFDALDWHERIEALDQLSGFAEDRYLHQTVIRTADGSTKFISDLPRAIRAIDSRDQPSGEWRIHFHVPVYLERFGRIGTTRSEIIKAVRASREVSGVEHFEVETYAWEVLPQELRQADLAAGIARELVWFEARCRNESCGPL